MSSKEDTEGGRPPEEPKPPDINLGDSSGPSNEPTSQAHLVSQPQGVTSDPVSPDNTEHDETGSKDARTPVEAHTTVSQGSDISSIDPHDTPVESQSIEDQQGEAEQQSSAVEPETPEAAQPPASTADQNPATLPQQSSSDCSHYCYNDYYPVHSYNPNYQQYTTHYC